MLHIWQCRPTAQTSAVHCDCNRRSTAGESEVSYIDISPEAVEREALSFEATYAKPHRTADMLRALSRQLAASNEKLAALQRRIDHEYSREAMERMLPP